jgi:hypothetical protein
LPLLHEGIPFEIGDDGEDGWIPRAIPIGDDDTEENAACDFSDTFAHGTERFYRNPRSSYRPRPDLGDASAAFPEESRLLGSNRRRVEKKPRIECEVWWLAADVDIRGRASFMKKSASC